MTNMLILTGNVLGNDSKNIIVKCGGTVKRLSKIGAIQVVHDG